MASHERWDLWEPTGDVDVRENASGNSEEDESED